MANGEPKTIRELFFYIKSEFSKLQSIQTELTEHKNNHWKMISLIVGINTTIIAIIGLILKNI